MASTSDAPDQHIIRTPAVRGNRGCLSGVHPKQYAQLSVWKAAPGTLFSVPPELLSHP